MEVFVKYFRRLLVGNSPQIFPGISRNVENPGNYPLLVEEIDKVAKDPEQAQKIAEAIETSDEGIFRDFDLSTFVNHFKLDPICNAVLVGAFLESSKLDLRNKGISSSAPSRTPIYIPQMANLQQSTRNTADTVPPVSSKSRSWKCRKPSSRIGSGNSCI